MSKPRPEIVMARCAGSAVLAAIEIYNKPTVEYREQTFSLLMVNAWEVLLKARLVQQAGGKLKSIYRRKGQTRYYDKNPHTGQHRTIGLFDALRQINPPKEIRNNIEGLNEIRNQTAHMGVLRSESKQAILAFGTASVRNFVKLSDDWFGESPEATYLLPVGFLGEASATQSTTTGAQQDLLTTLRTLSETSSSDLSDFAIVMQVDIELSRGSSETWNISLTSNENAPKVRMTDDEALEHFPTRYKELVGKCKCRYVNFKQNQTFNEHMKNVNEDPRSTYVRSLDPKGESSKKRFYNEKAVFEILDQHYQQGTES